MAPVHDRRTVGELLAENDELARMSLLDVSGDRAPGMVRGWGPTVEAAVRLWVLLPSPSLSHPDPDPMRRLHSMADGLRRSCVVGEWPGPGPVDERANRVAENFLRAADLIRRFGQDVQPTTPEVRADIAASRMRVMHTLYVGAHGIGVALLDHADQLTVQARRDHAQSRPLASRPDPREPDQARAMKARLDVFEQVAGRFVAEAGGVSVITGESKPVTRAERFASALAKWDIQAHRTLVAEPTAPNILAVARTQALIASAASTLTHAAGVSGIVGPAADRRFQQAINSSHAAWTLTARRWTELLDPAARTDPRLLGAAGETRAAAAAVTHDRHGWASPELISQRVALDATIVDVQLGVAASLDVAHLIRTIATTDPALTAPARVIGLRAQSEAERAIDHGETRYIGVDWVTPQQIRRNQMIPLPDPARRGLVDLAERVVSTSRDATDAGAATQSSPAARRNDSHSSPLAAPVPAVRTQVRLLREYPSR